MSSTFAHGLPTLSDMAAPGPEHHESTPDDAQALVNPAQAKPISNPQNPPLTDQFWDGSKETLAAFYKEFETTLSYVSPALYTLAVEGFIHEQGRTVIFTLGQAAQLEGDMPRNLATWDNPASTDPRDYFVSDDAIRAAHARVHNKNYFKNPTIGPDPPALPPGTLYPLNETYYRLSTSLLRNSNMQLRNTVLKFIADNAMRTILAQQFPDDGRALLAHLRDQAKIPLTTSQVNSILADIDALTDAGLKFDDVASFRQYGVLYHRILSRIPDANPNKDTRAVQARTTLVLP